MDVCQSSLRRADHASTGVLPTVVRRCVWSRNLVNVEALTHWGLSRQKQQNNLQLTRLCNKAVYFFKYWFSLKKAINNSRNVTECYRVQDWVKFVGDKLVFTILIVVLPCILISMKFTFQQMHYLL
jgi:L-cystine uptake protein TcyP (sodium:dicarboxylate symporter family)